MVTRILHHTFLPEKSWLRTEALWKRNVETLVEARVQTHNGSYETRCLLAERPVYSLQVWQSLHLFRFDTENRVSTGQGEELGPCHRTLVTVLSVPIGKLSGEEGAL